jgi:hypothetical protein
MIRSTRKFPARKRIVAGALALGLVAAACGDDDSGSDGTGSDGTAGENSEAVCPSNMVIQVDWWPEAEHGGTYQLMGDGAEADANLFTYSGPIDPAYAIGGIETLEIRAGGDAIEAQPVATVMKTDQEIVLGYLNSDDIIQAAPTVEVTAVASTLEINPQMVMWDPAQLEIDKTDPASIAATGRRVLHFPAAAYIDFLISSGVMTADQSDPNYSGAPDQWVSNGGDFIQQGFATNEIHKYANLIDWKDGAPAEVDFLLIDDLGWQPYPGSYTVLTERLDDLSPCLELFVPKLQQAWVDFLADPAPIGDEIIAVTEVYDNFWTLSPELNETAFALFESTGIGSNGPDDTYGNFDAERLSVLFDQMSAILDESGIDLPDGYTAESSYTNDFIDPAIGR